MRFCYCLCALGRVNCAFCLGLYDQYFYPSIAQCIGHTPLVRVQRLLPEGNNTFAVKIEGITCRSVKDRPALYDYGARKRGEISPGDTLIEATSGNTGIALVMAAAVLGYDFTDVPSPPRPSAAGRWKPTVRITLVDNGMEGARDLAQEMAACEVKENCPINLPNS